MIVYLAVNRVNQKAYVGQTTGTLRNRAMEHLREGGQTFCSALRKYGIDNFDFAVLENCYSAEEMNSLERRWIEILGCVVPNGYNRHSGGGPKIGYGHTGNSKRKLSAIRREMWKNPEYRKKLSDAHWTKSTRAEQIRQDLSDRTKKQHESGILGGYRGGGIKTPQSRAKARASALKNWNEEKRSERSERMKQLWSDPEYRKEHQAKLQAGHKRNRQ